MTHAGDVKKPVVFVAAAKVEESSENLVFPAQIVSRLNSRIVAEGEGIVVKIEKSAGSRVKAGDLLAVIKNTDPAYDYAPLKTLAAVSGAVASWDVSEGSIVTRGQNLGSLVDPVRVKIVVEVPAIDRSKVKVGQKALLRTESSPDAIPLRVTSLSPALDPVTGTLHCELTPEKISSELNVGLLAKVEIRGASHPAILIPQDAIAYKEGKKYLRTVVEKKAKFVAIQSGKNFGEKVEIVSGVKPGAVVILRASGFVGDGQDVEIFEPETKSAASAPGAQPPKAR